MKSKNRFWVLAGIINFGIVIIHLTLGQVDLINPLMESELSLPVKAELLAMWHMVSIVLLLTSVVYFQNGRGKKENKPMILWISNLYILFSLVFICSGIYNSIFVPQWILLLPIGIMGLIGIKKQEQL